MSPQRKPSSNIVSEADSKTVRTQTSSGADSEASIKSIDRRSNPRLKRKRESNSEQIAEMMAEMRSMFADFRAHQSSQDSTLEKISSSMDEIKAQNLELRQTVDFVSNKLDSVQTQIDKLETDRNKNLQYIQVLEQKLENLERYRRSTCVEIKNIPHSKGESKLSLITQLSTLANVLNTPIDPQHVKDIFRITTRDPNMKTIIIEFNSVLTKEHLIRKYREYNKSNSTCKLNTETLGITGPRNPVYVSENLSPQMKRLHYIAKDFASSNGYKHCWVTNGKIFLRKKEGTSLILINSEHDLKNLEKPNNIE
ncbi:uncharacterized protein LOC125230330 [Leguminivora glycinivorella]|uniref:uncharacterized protein LOC125230330 n=1 Tax=Leguminivora glycinivorella TaxID=1035111 RepID=UPI00200BC155|nr:uncharacterized protein LOC125230330 [Leguminivora glycinivorella]